jgi:deazaflavin-dependent oxidoreductase (nitroreductase family)
MDPFALVPPAVKDATARGANLLHRALFDATNGRIGGHLAGMPVVKLTTTGRRSGQPRTSMLTSPVQEGDRMILVASYGGDDRAPAWFHNLRANPEVEVVTGGRSMHMRATVASDEDRDRLWPEVTRRYKGYAGYQRNTERRIPLVWLEPLGR